ncbi:MAG: DnaT-like ssDNA-binding domain-containing protein [Oceanospirillaceae bacterium]
MSFPEIPLLVYPSLARRYGVEEALLFYICKQLFNSHNILSANNGSDLNSIDIARVVSKPVVVSLNSWALATQIWDKEKLEQLCNSLHRQNVMAIDIQNNTVAITDIIANFENNSVDSNEVIGAARSASLKDSLTKQAEQYNVNELVQEPVSHLTQSASGTQVLPVYDAPPVPPAMPLPRRRESEVVAQPAMNNTTVLKGIGPAPSFGGSTGWKKRTGDALHTLFDQQEVLNKQLQSMSMDWKPSAMFYSTLTRNNIPQAVANSCLDEFILFYCDKNTKERSWDQKFLAWVKRAWVKQQSNDNRVQSSSQKTGSGHENSQRDTREKRKRITAAIMDIHDTNW